MTSVVWNRASTHQLIRGVLYDHDRDGLPALALWALRLAEWRLRRDR